MLADTPTPTLPEPDAVPEPVEAPSASKPAPNTVPLHQDPGLHAQPDERDLEALAVIRELCQSGGFAAEPEIKAIEGSYLHVDLVGDDAQRLFGSHGKMLDALQYVANLIVGRRLGPGIRVLLDADGYRQKRTELLEEMARKYAALVVERQQECEFDPLPPHERRIIHRLFADDAKVLSYSEGEEPDRKVVLAPRQTAE